MSKHVVIIGGGIIGLMSAYYLTRDDQEVTLIDRSGIPDGCSYMNAGLITPGHIKPFAAPGMVKKGIKYKHMEETWKNSLMRYSRL